MVSGMTDIFLPYVSLHVEKCESFQEAAESAETPKTEKIDPEAGEYVILNQNLKFPVPFKIGYEVMSNVL